MSEIRNENQPTWTDIEVALATEIVEESKKKSRKWFTAWVNGCDSRCTGGEQPCMDYRRYQ